MHFGCSTQKRNVHCNTDVKRTQNLIEIPPHVLLRLLVHAVRADYHRIPAIKNLLGCLSGAAGSSNRTPARPTNKSTCHCGPARGAMARQGSRCAECSMSPCKWEQAQQAEDMVWSQPEPPSYQWNSPGAAMSEELPIGPTVSNPARNLHVKLFCRIYSRPPRPPVQPRLRLNSSARLAPVFSAAGSAPVCACILGRRSNPVCTGQIMGWIAIP